MSVKIRVQNFQSLVDVSIEVDHLTVVTGANNTGKSSLMRAIRAAFQNLRGTSFIRHGETKARVDIEFDDGRTLAWEKGRARGDKPTYIIDGGDPIYPGQGVPPEVAAFGVCPITAANREIWPQVAPQFTGQVFLLDLPGSVMAEAVADVERVRQLNDALRLATSDKRSASSELGVRRGDHERLTIELDRFDGLDELATEVTSLEESAQLAQRIEVALESLFGLRDRLVEASTAVSDLSGIEDVTPPEDAAFTTVDLLHRQLQGCVHLQERLNEASTAVDSLSGIEAVAPPETDAFDTVALLQEELRGHKLLRDRRVGAQEGVASLEGVEDVTVDVDPAKATRLVEALQTAKDFQTRLIKVRVQIETLEQVLSEDEADEAELTKELLETLGTIGACPVCGSINHQEH